MKILWLGCGDIGNRFGKYVCDSHQCFGVRRQIANVQPPLIPIFADILDRENMHSVMSNDFDIVIVDRNGKIKLLDIKTNTYRKNNKGKSLKNKPKGSYRICRSPTKEQKRLNIKLLMVDYKDS